MIPFSTWGERLDFLVRIGLAYGLMVVLLVLNVVALPHPFTGFVQIPIVLLIIYYWSIYRPTLLPAFLVFLAGLFLDIMGGGPLGVNALIFFAVHRIVTDQRSFLLGQSFLMIWLGFGIVNSGVVLLRWLVFGVFQLNWNPVAENFPSISIGLISFPFIAALLHLSHRILPSPKMPLIGHNAAD